MANIPIKLPGPVFGKDVTEAVGAIGVVGAFVMTLLLQSSPLDLHLGCLLQ